MKKPTLQHKILTKLSQKATPQGKLLIAVHNKYANESSAKADAWERLQKLKAAKLVRISKAINPKTGRIINVVNITARGKTVYKKGNYQTSYTRYDPYDMRTKEYSHPNSRY